MTYSHKQNGPNTDIYRGDDHVATFDPVAEELTVTDPRFKKYRGRAKIYLKSLDTEKVDPVTADPVTADPVTADPVEEKFTPKEKEQPQVNLKRENMRLKIENVKLQDEVAKLRGDQATSIQRVPDRYSDEFDDSKGVELKGPHGDMTPKYVEWARKNMPKEIFARRYRGRLKE